ncbi:MAG: hypothetical protein HYX32_05100 [Actinobacteria bacterium]|nr:hypothetical protein [Actinomycetota bacterium]
MFATSFLYKLVFLLHLASVVVGFGSSFVYPVLGAKARGLGPSSPKESYAIAHAGLETSKIITTPMIYAAGAFGIVLVFLSEGAFKFSQAWISIAFLLFIAAALIAALLHLPNLKAMDALQAKLAAGTVTPNPAGGPPAEVAELAERGSKAGAYGGLLHVLWLLLMIDMIWKPGFSLFGS